MSSRLTQGYGFWTAVSVVVSNMIGVGIFTTSGFMARDIGHVGLILLAWALGGILAICGAVSYAELGAAYPRAGGEYVYLREAFGPRAGFLSGWVSVFVGFAGPVAATAIGFTEYLSVFMPELQVTTAPGLAVTPGKLFAICVIWIVSAVHAFGIDTSALVQTGITILKVAGVVLFIAFGFAIGNGEWSQLQPVSTESSNATFAPFAVAMIFVMFSYSGWNASTYIAEEIQDPGRNIPRSVIGGTLLVTGLYLALNALYFYAIPVREAAGVLKIGEVAARTLFGGATARWLTLFFALSILACLSAMVVAGPRVCLAMSRDGCFFPAFGRFHPTRRTPTRAVFLQAAIASVYILTGSFDQIVTYCGFILFIFSALTVIALFRLRRTDAQRLRPYRAWGYPLVPALFILACAWIVVFTLVQRPFESGIGLLVLVVGLVFYELIRSDRLEASR